MPTKSAATRAVVPAIKNSTNRFCFEDNNLLFLIMYQYNFYAKLRPGIATILVTSKNGKSLTCDIEVIAPSGIGLKEILNTGYHIKGMSSAGFMAHVYVLPNNVSFKDVLLFEGRAKPITTEYFTAPNMDIAIHEEGQKCTVKRKFDGINYLCIDKITGQTSAQGAGRRYFAGSYSYKIPLYYVDADNKPVQFGLNEQVNIINKYGDFTVRKCGIEVTRKLNDETEIGLQIIKIYP